MAWNLISLIVSEPRTDSLTYPTQPGVGYIGFHGEKCAKESKFPFHSFLPKSLFLPLQSSAQPAPALPRLLLGILLVKIPTWRRRKRDETSKKVHFPLARSIQLHLRATGWLNREASTFFSHRFAVHLPKSVQDPSFPLLLFTFPPRLLWPLQVSCTEKKSDHPRVRIRHNRQFWLTGFPNFSPVRVNRGFNIAMAPLLLKCLVSLRAKLQNCLKYDFSLDLYCKVLITLYLYENNVG